MHMKKYYILLFLLLGALNAKGAEYLVNDGTEHQIMTGASKATDYQFSVSVPANALFFSVKKQTAGTGKIEVYAYTDASCSQGETLLDNYSPSTSYATKGIDLSQKANYLSFRSFRFHATGTLKKYVKDIVVTAESYFKAPTPNSLTFPEKEVETEDETLTFSFDYCNAGTVTTSYSGSPTFTVNTGSFDTYHQYGTHTLTVTHSATLAGTQTGTITLTNGTTTYTVALSATVHKHQSYITFKPNTDKLSVGSSWSDPAFLSEGLDLLYTSSDPSILSVEGNTLTALSAGTVTLTASFAGNDKWTPATASKTVTVTDLLTQQINWAQSFLHLRPDAAPLTLTATATSGLPVSYAVGNTDIVRVENGQLVVVGEGTTTLTATQSGNELYAAASPLTETVVVKAVTTGCNPLVCDVSDDYYITPGGLIEADGHHYHLQDIPGGCPGFVTFEAKKTVGGTGSLTLQQTLDGSHWTDLVTVSPTTKYQSFGPYAVDSSAVQLRFLVKKGSLNFHFQNVQVTLRRFLVAQPNALSFLTNAGSYESQTLQIRYSNIPNILSVTCDNENFTPSLTSIGLDCGELGEQALQVTFHPLSAGDYTGNLIIATPDNAMRLVVPLTGTAQKTSQSIVWSLENNQTLTLHDHFVCNAYATSSLPVSYTSSDPSVAEVLADGTLVLHTLGTFTVTASQAGNHAYLPALSVSKTFVVEPPVCPWLCVLPQTEAYGGDVQVTDSDTLYHHLLYVLDGENFSDLKITQPLAFQMSEHLALTISQADTWINFVAPFDIDKVQVLELIPDNALQSLTREQAAQRQKEKNTEFLTYFAQASKTQDVPMSQLIDAYVQTHAGADVFDLTHYNGSNMWTADYYAYQSGEVWTLTDSTQSGLLKDWEIVTQTSGTIFEKGKTYALQFPFCSGCTDRTGYDYWSGKMILLTASTGQAVSGEEVHEQIHEVFPVSGTAQMTGNYSLCALPLEADEAYLHDQNPADASYDLYVLQHEPVEVAPTTPLLFANAHNAQGLSPRAITRRGVAYYDQQTDADASASTATSLPNVLSQDDHLTVLLYGSHCEIYTAQPSSLWLYNAAGQELLAGATDGKNAFCADLPMGLYVIKSEHSVAKIFVP